MGAELVNHGKCVGLLCPVLIAIWRQLVLLFCILDFRQMSHFCSLNHELNIDSTEKNWNYHDALASPEVAKCSA
jgi:hypothetical protein